MPRKVALGMTLALFLIKGNQADQRWFPLRRNYVFLTQEYSITVATWSEPTALPPSRYQIGVLWCANDDFSYNLHGKIQLFGCIRVVFGNFAIMVLSHYFNHSMTAHSLLTLLSQEYFYNIYPLIFLLYLVSFLPTKHHFL